MKRLFISAIIMMAFALNASAQLAPGKFSLQFKVGVSGSSFSNSTDINVGQLQDQFIHLNGLPSNILDTTLEDEGAGGGTIGVDLEYQAAKWLGLSVGIVFLFRTNNVIIAVALPKLTRTPQRLVDGMSCI